MECNEREQIISEHLPRVTQLDAEYLDDETHTVLKMQLITAVKYCGQNTLTKFEPELEALLRYVVLKYTVENSRASIGQQLLQVKYPDSVPNGCLKLYVAGIILGYWGKTRFGDIIRLVTGNRDLIQKLTNISDGIEVSYKILHLLNLLLFLHEGKYPSVLQRVLALQPVSALADNTRRLSYAYFTRELLWHGFAELLAFVLPFINLQRFHNSLKKLISSRSNEDYTKKAAINYNCQTTCSICNRLPVLPHMYGCDHLACYFCIHSAYAGDLNYVCPLCPHRIESKAQILPVQF